FPRRSDGPRAKSEAHRRRWSDRAAPAPRAKQSAYRCSSGGFLKVCGGQRPLDEIEPVLAPEQFIADNICGRAENAAPSGFGEVGLPFIDDGLALRIADEIGALAADGGQRQFAQGVEVGDVAVLGP